MSTCLFNSNCWRARADEARAYADVIEDRQMAARLQVIADHYDAIATRARADEQRQQVGRMAMASAGVIVLPTRADAAGNQ